MAGLEAPRGPLPGLGYDEPSADEAALISQRIMGMETETGVKLDDDDFERVGELIHRGWDRYR